MPGLIRGEATKLGEEEVTLGPATPVPPILIGGNSEAAMRRAVLHGYGWVPSLISPAALAKKVIRLREIAHELGRPVPSIASPAQVAERLHAYSEAGADMVGLSLDGGDWTRQAEALAKARAQLSHALAKIAFPRWR